MSRKEFKMIVLLENVEFNNLKSEFVDYIKDNFSEEAATNINDEMDELYDKFLKNDKFNRNAFGFFAENFFLFLKSKHPNILNQSTIVFDKCERTHLFDETVQDLMFQIHIPIRYLNLKMYLKKSRFNGKISCNKINFDWIKQ